MTRDTLCRIIFCEMVRGNELDTTVYGVSSYLQDNEHQLIHVKMKDGTVTIGENTWTYPSIRQRQTNRCNTLTTQAASEFADPSRWQLSNLGERKSWIQ